MYYLDHVGRFFDVRSHSNKIENACDLIDKAYSLFTTGLTK